MLDELSAHANCDQKSSETTYVYANQPMANKQQQQSAPLQQSSFDCQQQSTSFNSHPLLSTNVLQPQDSAGLKSNAGKNPGIQIRNRYFADLIFFYVFNFC